MKDPQPRNLIKGMKGICQYLDISEATALKWYRELDLPIKKTSENGYWVGSRVKLDGWVDEFLEK